MLLSLYKIDNMAKRHTELSTDVVMNFRINQRMKDAIDQQADAAGISSAEWIRRVLQEKLDGTADEELKQKIRAVYEELIAERMGKQ